MSLGIWEAKAQSPLLRTTEDPAARPWKAGGWRVGGRVLMSRRGSRGPGPVLSPDSGQRGLAQGRCLTRRFSYSSPGVSCNPLLIFWKDARAKLRGG